MSEIKPHFVKAWRGREGETYVCVCAWVDMFGWVGACVRARLCVCVCLSICLCVCVCGCARNRPHCQAITRVSEIKPHFVKACGRGCVDICVRVGGGSPRAAQKCGKGVRISRRISCAFSNCICVTVGALRDGHARTCAHQRKVKREGGGESEQHGRARIIPSRLNS